MFTYTISMANVITLAPTMMLVIVSRVRSGDRDTGVAQNNTHEVEDF